MIRNFIKIEMFDDGTLKFQCSKDKRAIIHMLSVVIKMLFDSLLKSQEKEKSKITIPKVGVN